MGINGLKTYITNRSELYLEPFDLHDTYVVIDGYNIASRLYSCTKSNCAFGGDYDEYGQCVRQFFENLLKCNITPLIILDGGSEDRKLQTRINRTREKVQKAKSYTPLSQSKLRFLPPLLGYVFDNIVEELNIKKVKCLFEADNDIAAIAKCLKCPVISDDSDFYICGALYIPFNTMDSNITRKWRKQVICCKIYIVQCLLNTFPGLDELKLSLASILLGNDYIQQDIFKHFYQHIKFPKRGQLLYNKRQCCIEGIFHWLSEHTLHTAISMIIKNVPCTDKETVFKEIKIIIEQYTNLSTNVLTLLGFSKEYIDSTISQNVNNNSNIQANVNYQKTMEELSKALEITYIDDSKFEIETKAFIESLPTWFIDEYHKASLPSYFMNLLLGRLSIFHVQIEDFCQPSSVFIGVKIVNVIFTLLTLKLKGNVGCAKYLTRGDNNELTEYPLEYIDNIFPCNIPSIHDLRNISLTTRKEIFDVTLGVKEPINDFPNNWKLYIAIAKYWTEHLTNVRSNAHIYALLFAMLHHIIDAKIGYYRSINEFQTKYKKNLLSLESKKKKERNHLSYSTNMSIIQALDAIEIDDCILSAPFFIINSEMDKEHYTNPSKFRTSVVHLFAMFQICIENSFNLNALLGFPYKVTDISEMFNGTLLYNLYNNFDKHNDIENHINSILQGSSTLLQLFNIILIKTKLMFKITEF